MMQWNEWCIQNRLWNTEDTEDYQQLCPKTSYKTRHRGLTWFVVFDREWLHDPCLENGLNIEDGGEKAGERERSDLYCKFASGPGRACFDTFLFLFSLSGVPSKTTPCKFPPWSSALSCLITTQPVGIHCWLHIFSTFWNLKQNNNIQYLHYFRYFAPLTCAD